MIGRVFGSYVVTAPLGKGAMGEVFEARHKTLGKRVAIKVLRADAKDGDVAERFFNEARAASAVEHRGIVEVIDFGRAEDDDRPYLVMELLDGETLGVRLRRDGAMDAEAAIRIVRQVLGALGAAHARGIIHRDLKPDNVFLIEDPDLAGGLRAKVVDFGIAKLADPAMRGGVATHQGALIGTPAYMAPEQCRGSVEIDRRADLYAIGCILFEMLSGRPPFEQTGVGDLLAAHMFEFPPALGDKVPGVSPRLAAIVERLLGKRPEDRFASAAELLAALDGGELPRRVSAPRPAAPDANAATYAPGSSETMPAHPAMSSTSTLSGAAGEGTDVNRPRSRRGPVALAALVVVGALAFAIWHVSRDELKRAAPPEAQVSLGPAQLAIAEQRWDDAVTAVDAFLVKRPRDPEAARLRARALAEQASRVVFQDVKKAIAADQLEAVVTGFRSLSGSSVYYGLLSGLYQGYRARTIDARRPAIAAAVAAKDCAKVRALDADLRRWFPDVDPFAGVDACAERDAPQVITSESLATRELPAFPVDGIPKDVLDLVFRNNFDRFRACHASGLPGGTIALRVVVGTSGVSSVEITDDPIGDAALAACVTRVARSMVFPPPDGGGTVTVNYPIAYAAH